MRKFMIVMVLLMIIVFMAGCHVDNWQAQAKVEDVSNLVTTSGCSACSVPSEYVPPEDLKAETECADCGKEIESSNCDKCDDCKLENTSKDLE